MQRFVCEQNIAHFQTLLATASDPTLRQTLETLLAAAKRELALVNSERSGAQPHAPFARAPAGDPHSLARRVDPEFDASPHPYMIIDPGPGLRILDINASYARATFIRREDVVGRPLFEVFPDNPELHHADGVSNLYDSLRIVAETGRPHAMAAQRYDVRDATGAFVEKHWQPINTPVHDEQGRLICLLHHVEDVTETVRGQRA